MRSSKLSGYIFMNYSARTSAAGGGEQTRAAAPLAEGFPARRPPQPLQRRGRERSPGEIRRRVGSGSPRCAGVSTRLYAVMYRIHCCVGVSSVAWSCCCSPRAFPTLPGMRGRGSTPGPGPVRAPGMEHYNTMARRRGKC